MESFVVVESFCVDATSIFSSISILIDPGKKDSIGHFFLCFGVKSIRSESTAYYLSLKDMLSIESGSILSL